MPPPPDSNEYDYEYEDDDSSASAGGAGQDGRLSAPPGPAPPARPAVIRPPTRPGRRPPTAATRAAYPAKGAFDAGADEADEEREDAEIPVRPARSRLDETQHTSARPGYGAPAAERPPRGRASAARPGGAARAGPPPPMPQRRPSGPARAAPRNPLPYAIAAFAGVVLLGLLALALITGQSRPTAPVAQGAVPPTSLAGNNPAPTNPPPAGDTPPRMSLDAFKKLYDDPAQRPLIIDVRDPTTYAAGHIVGAESFPEADVDTRVKELPKDKLVVAYCQ